MTVAKWWGFDPDVVGNWSMPDFTDRQEYMFLQMEIEIRLSPSNRQEDDENVEYWKGPDVG